MRCTLDAVAEENRMGRVSVDTGMPRDGFIAGPNGGPRLARARGAAGNRDI
jgi:hypothetical protein